MSAHQSCEMVSGIPLGQVVLKLRKHNVVVGLSLTSPTIDQMVSLMAVGTSDTFTVAGCIKASIYKPFATHKNLAKYS